MEFPLVPACSLNVSLRERANHVPQSTAEFPPPSWATPNPAILLRTYKPAANTFFIDSQYMQKFESVEPSETPSNWGDSLPRTAKYYYQKTAAGQQQKKHTVDLYV
jgi:hypothetical protein